MSLFGKKPSSVSAGNLPAYPFANVSGSDVSNDFGNASSQLNPLTGNWTTGGSMSSSLANIYNPATQTAANSFGYLSRNPSDSWADINAGNNPYYNLLNQQTQRNYASSLAQAAMQAQQTGNDNSTAYGELLGRIANDNILRQNQNAVDAYNWGNQNALQNAQASMGALGQIYNQETGLQNQANQNVLQSGLAQDAMIGQHAQNALSAQLANQQAQMAYNQQQASGIGSLLGAGLTLGLMPFGIGGATGLGGSLLGSMFNGGGGGSVAGSIGGGLGNIAGGFSNPWAYATSPAYQGLNNVMAAI